MPAEIYSAFTKSCKLVWQCSTSTTGYNAKVYRQCYKL